MMQSIQFFGAAGTVTGSNFLLTHESGSRLVIDMGMFQGDHKLERLNMDDIPFDPRSITGVVLTHAHLDHAGRMPLMIRHGYTGPFYMTRATRVLAELTLLDSAKIIKEHEGRELYSEKDIAQMFAQTIFVEYGKPFVAGAFEVTFRDAGHILGSASVELVDTLNKNQARKIVFSGDLGNSPEELVRPTELIDSSDIVVMESTYGDRLHKKEDANQVLTEEIGEIEKSGGTLLIPSFSIERSQEILHKIDHLKKQMKIREDTRVFLDSPMAIKATMIYKEFRDLYSKELTEHAKMDDPFNFTNLFMVDRHHDSKRIAGYPGPKVIIAGAGMMTGGRIMNHAVTFLPLPSTRLLFVGYQGEETLGRAILDGDREVTIGQTNVHIRASVRKSSGMSAHADQAKLHEWLNHIAGVKRVFLVHGEQSVRAVFGQEIQKHQASFTVDLPLRNAEYGLE